MKFHRDGDRLLQLLIFNEEFLVSASHQLALITSLPFVHTARRSYRLNDPVRPPDWGDAFGSPDATLREAVQTLLFRGRRSRNKVSVGEPAEGSFRWNRPTHPRTVMVGGAPAAPTLLSNQHRKPRTEDRLVGRVLRSALRAGDTNQRQLSTMDILALATMKNAAKCDT